MKKIYVYAKVVRKTEYQTHTWNVSCQERGLSPSYSFVVEEIDDAYSTVFLNHYMGDWDLHKFEVVEDIRPFNREDYL